MLTLSFLLTFLSTLYHQVYLIQLHSSRRLLPKPIMVVVEQGPSQVTVASHAPQPTVGLLIICEFLLIVISVGCGRILIHSKCVHMHINGIVTASYFVVTRC